MEEGRYRIAAIQKPDASHPFDLTGTLKTGSELLFQQRVWLAVTGRHRQISESDEQVFKMKGCIE